MTRRGPLVDLDCSNRSIIIVGSGDTAALLSGAVADNGPDAVRYLRTADTCDTDFGPWTSPLRRTSPA